MIVGCKPVKTQFGESFSANISVSSTKSNITVTNSRINIGSTSTIKLTLYDKNGDPYVSSKKVISFAANGGTSKGTISTVTNNGNGTYQATFTATELGSATTINAYLDGSAIGLSESSLQTITVVSRSLEFVTGPTTTLKNHTISPSVTVKVLNLDNSIDTTSTNSITLSIGTNPVSGTLSGSLTKTPVKGVATFDDLIINAIGSGYKLKAASSGLESINSSSFNISDPSTNYEWPFDALTTSDYTFSNSSKLEFSGGICRLPEIIQTDSESTEISHGTFSAGTKSGVVYSTLSDGTSNGLKLGNSGGCDGTAKNCASLESSWVPKWSALVGYWQMENNWNDSNGTSDGTAQGNATFTGTSKIGNYAGTFDGTGEKVI
jgi:hypothetical protein